MIPGSGNLSPQGHSPLSQSGANGFGSLNQQNDPMENVSFLFHSFIIFSMSVAVGNVENYIIKKRDPQVAWNISRFIFI